MYTINTNRLKVQGLLGLLLGCLISCTSKDAQAITEKEAAGNVPGDIVTLTESQFSEGHMELGKISPNEFTTVVKANGMFDVPPENKALVSAYFAGYVKDITLLPGEAVKKGQVLFTLENPEYVQVQQAFLEASGRLNYLKSDYERQKTLLDDNVTSQKNFLKAEAEYKVTLAQYQSLKKKLGLMNIDPNTLTGENISATIGVLSPLSGYVTSIEAGKGMFLTPSDVAMTITDTSNLHIELKIFEQDLPVVKVGQIIKIRVQNDTQQVYLGEVHLVNKAIDPVERTVNIHGDLTNEEDAKLFAPGMYIEAEILTSKAFYPALPVEAIANIENNFYVLVKEGETTFKRKSVKVGASDNGYTQILNVDDFDGNATFLTKGAFNLIKE